MTKTATEYPTSSASYTAALAYEPTRISSRTTFGNYCLLSWTPSSVFLDKSLGYASVLSYMGCSIVIFGGTLSLVPSMFFSKYVMKWPSIVNKNMSDQEAVNNISTTAVGSITAIKTLSARPQMNRQGSGGPDYMAPRLCSFYGTRTLCMGVPLGKL